MLQSLVRGRVAASVSLDWECVVVILVSRDQDGWWLLARRLPVRVCHAVGCGCSVASGYVWDSADCSKPICVPGLSYSRDAAVPTSYLPVARATLVRV
jgi:hypothetical protein